MAEEEYDNLESSEPSPRSTRSTRSRRRRQREEEFNARRNLRNTKVDLTQAELKLRRLESFVTSDQYELQKEIARLDTPR